MLKFSPANAKIRALRDVASLQGFLSGKRKVYSFDLLSGHSCPYAKDCHSKAVVQPDGRRIIVDGPHTDFRCFSASQEVLFTNVYKHREANMAILETAATVGAEGVASELQAALPQNAGIVRIHVGGDFKTRPYFEGWMLLAERNPSILFYGYTKSLPFWVANRQRIRKMDNFILTASRGGYQDALIGKYRLRSVVVVPTVEGAGSLEIDHDDSHAADPSKRGQNFALLIHGPQPAGSSWGKAVRTLNGVGSYQR